MTDAAVPDEPHEFRPSWSAFHRRMLRRAIWLLPLAVLLVLIAAGPSIGVGVIAIGVAVLAVGVAMSLYFGRMRVEVDEKTLGIRGALRTRRWSRADIGTLVFIPLPTGPDRATLYGVSPGFERMFSLSGEVWESDELEQIAAALGAPIVHAPVGVSPKELQERYPGTVGWTVTRPWLFALLLAGIFVAVLVVSALISTIVLVASGDLVLPSGG